MALHAAGARLTRLSLLLAVSCLGTGAALLGGRTLLSASRPALTPLTPAPALEKVLRWSPDPERRREASLLLASRIDGQADPGQELRLLRAQPNVAPCHAMRWRHDRRHHDHRPHRHHPSHPHVMCLCFRGTGARISAQEEEQYHPDVVVMWQRKAWYDSATCNKWVVQYAITEMKRDELGRGERAARLVSSRLVDMPLVAGERHLILCDNLAGQTKRSNPTFGKLLDEHCKATVFNLLAGDDVAALPCLALLALPFLHLTCHCDRRMH